MIVKQVSGAIGAIIEDVQLDKNLHANTISEIYDVFLKYQVIFFRNQNLTPESLIYFAKKIGKPISYPFVKGLNSFPEITPILKKKLILITLVEYGIAILRIRKSPQNVRFYML